jgi:hypothetical protein
MQPYRQPGSAPTLDASTLLAAHLTVPPEVLAERGQFENPS